MDFKWQKKGLIFSPEGRYDWMYSHAQAPCLLELHDRYRIFFTCRPKADATGSVSLIAYIDVDINDPSKIIYIHNSPVLQLGGPGDFDEFGTHPATLLKKGNDILFYYQGWERGYSVPYKTSLGLAISKDGGNTFIKVAKGPLFSRTPQEPYLENGFFVLKNEDKYLMWYATCTEWIKTNDKLEPYYFIVQAESDDGINWKRDPTPILKKTYEKEVSGRPTVIKIKDTFHMWFCYRDIFNFRAGSGAYQIGYAYSTDLKTWTRHDSKAGITLSADGWDSKMMSYPYIIRKDNKLYLFYNGNEFGKHGFGFAKMDIDQ